MASLPASLDGDTYLPRIIELTRSSLGAVPTRAYLFGSRAAGTARPGSDYDIAIESDADLDDVLWRARTALEDSTIPNMVDLIDLQTCDADFRSAVLSEGIALW